MELPTKQDCRIVKFRESIDIENREQWPTAFAWLSEQARLSTVKFITNDEPRLVHGCVRPENSRRQSALGAASSSIT
jgi:hypothetical protein